MSRRRPLRSEIWEGETLWTRALIERDSDFAPMRISDGTTFDVYVQEIGTRPQQVYILLDQPVSDAFSDSLRSSGWEGQEDGYNFAWSIGPSDYAFRGGVAYQAEFTIHTVSDGIVQLVHITDVQPLYST